ncbi:alpha/beta hydrolase family protein [Jatrophihabitans sp. YIM 134969]
MAVTRRTMLLATAAAAVGGLVGCGRAPSPEGDGMTASTRVTYGGDPSQWVDRYDVPAGVPVRACAVAVVHGGFWRAQYDASLGVPLAEDLAARGWPAWNVEYRRVGDGGGWPTTLDDVRTALEHVDAERLVLLGHSAGGQLVTWAAGQPSLRGRVAGAVSQAGVLDLVGAAENGVGGTAVPDLLGGTPTDVPDRYASASPLAHLPLGVPVRCVHARADANVPYEQSVTYVDAATAVGDDATLTTVEGDHFTLIDTGSAAWTSIVGLIGDLST